MTAAFDQRVETDQLWQKFAAMVVDESYSISGGIPWPWFDGSNVWVCDRALLLRFPMFEAPCGEILWPYKSGLWKAPNADLIKWQPPVEHIGLISPEPCRKEMPVSVAGQPLNCDRLWKRLVPCQCDQGGDICGLCVGMGEYLETIDEAFERHRVFNRTFGRRYLWIVSQLPGLKIEVRRGAMQLQFEGGRGVLMGMNDEPTG
jgi:hypothetical protein